MGIRAGQLPLDVTLSLRIAVLQDPERGLICIILEDVEYNLLTAEPRFKFDPGVEWAV